ncbi:cilia- and flagella-associated protein 263-like isoform X1 [Lasioglossum baleicum]|uniref:cilia- and flagella-associated protein 263-like isoform X1 n=1 Tax=Lasioglossum baleicum TaxID=434251 RepID=UPI003FCD10B9
MAPMSMRGSIFSAASRMTQKQEEDIEYDSMTFEELVQMQDDNLQKIWLLSLENDVYERYITRVDPDVMKGITHLLQRTRHARKVTRMMSMRSSRMSFRDSVMTIPEVLRRFTVSSPASTPSIISVTSETRAQSVFPTWKPSDTSKIPIAHRMAMARKEVEHMTKNFEDLKLIVQKRTMMMRAEIEELEIRISEVQEAKQEFEENVVIKGVDPITGKIPAERVTRYIEEWLKSANTIIGRLRLKSATHRMLITKTRQQLVQREELGEALRAVDFEQLNIQNKDYVRMIEEKTIYMLDMKKIAGHYHLKLTQHKQKLSDLLRSLNALKKETSEKDKQIRELHVEHAHVENDVAKVETELNNLVGYVDSHSVPEILEFVMLQKEVQSLQKKYKLLQRRRYVEQILFQASLKYIYSKASQSRLELMRQKRISDTVFPIVPFSA